MTDTGRPISHGGRPGLNEGQSARRAATGSIRVALRTGTRHAAIATAVNKTAIAAKVAGSPDRRSASPRRSTRFSASAAVSPSASASASCVRPRLKINQDTWCGCAPTAMRSPISCVRCVTAYAITA